MVTQVGPSIQAYEMETALGHVFAHLYVTGCIGTIQPRHPTAHGLRNGQKPQSKLQVASFAANADLYGQC